jgi:putative ABC transport system ATP-binding protein
MTDPRTTAAHGETSVEKSLPGRPVAPVVLCRGLTHSYGSDRLHVQALRGIDLSVPRGSFVCLTGPSGSGRSTLLSLIAGLLPVQQGQLQVLGIEMAGLSPRQRRAVRRRIGSFLPVLIESLSAAQNVDLGLCEWHVPARERRQRVATVLEWVGLGHRGDHRPRELSGSQRVRAALARALVSEPPLILADEPTADLDEISVQEVIALLLRARDRDCTSLISTRDHHILGLADLRVTMRDGHVVSQAPTAGAGT